MLLIISRINVVSNLKLLTTSGTFTLINRQISQNTNFLKLNSFNNKCLTNRFATFQTVLQKQQPKEEKKQDSVFSSIVHKQETSNEVSTHFTGVKKVKQAATDFTYLCIIGVGAAMLFVIGYYLFSELFTRETPTGIFEESSKICLDNLKVQDALGHPIKVTAESGGRRVFHVKHKYFLEDNNLCLTLNYYLEGPKNKGTVICKLTKNESTGKLEYDHIVVKLDYPHRGENRIVVKTRDLDSNRI